MNNTKHPGRVPAYVEIPHWIPVSDGLPGESIYALVAIDTDPLDPEAWDMEVAWRYNDSWWDVGGATARQGAITHWCPLPETPSTMGIPE